MFFHLDSSKEDFLQDLTGSLLKISCHVRGKYGPLCCITSVVGATKMLNWFPNIPCDMFPLMSDRCLAPHVSNNNIKFFRCIEKTQCAYIAMVIVVLM